LKAFHLVFITGSVVLSLGFAAWCFLAPRGLEAGVATTLGIVAIAAGAALVSLERMILRVLPRRSS